MRTIVGALAIGVILQLPLAGSVFIQTVAQSDAHRSYIDTPAAAVSADGRFVAFTSYVQLAPADTNHQRDIYVLDRVHGSVTLESVALDGQTSPADGAHPGITGDGRFLVYQTCFFSSDAERTGNEPDGKAPRLDEHSEQSLKVEVVLRDRREGTTRILSAGPAGEPSNGSSRGPSISRDGRFVAFASTATNLVQGPDANGAGEDIYLVEMQTGAIRRISLDSRGVQASAGSSVSPSVSADGRYVAFASTAALDSPAINRQRALSQVYVRDTLLNTTRRVSGAPRAGPANGHPTAQSPRDGGPGAAPALGWPGRAPDGESWGPVISATGRYIAFVSTATNLAADDRNGSADVFFADLHTGTIELVSRSARNGSGNGGSGSPALSDDGRFVAFQSEASDLLCRRCSGSTEDINLLWDVFLFDRQTRVVTRLSADANGGWMEASNGPALDATGEIVAFSSRHPIDATDKKNDFDLFVVHRPQKQ